MVFTDDRSELIFHYAIVSVCPQAINSSMHVKAPSLTAIPTQPCRRCQREARDCVLGESHRGGRRVRKKPKIEKSPNTPTTSTPPESGTGLSTPTAPSSGAQFKTVVDYPHNQSSAQEFHSRYDTRNESGISWQQPTSTTAGSDTTSARHTDQGTVSFHFENSALRATVFQRTMNLLVDMRYR